MTKCDGKNYLQWKFQMKYTLMVKDVCECTHRNQVKLQNLEWVRKIIKIAIEMEKKDNKDRYSNVYTDMSNRFLSLTVVESYGTEK